MHKQLLTVRTLERLIHQQSQHISPCLRVSTHVWKRADHARRIPLLNMSDAALKKLSIVTQKSEVLRLIMHGRSHLGGLGLGCHGVLRKSHRPRVRSHRE